MVFWTAALHERFVTAVNELGGPRVATAFRIVTRMDVPGVTRQKVASHLQKYRQRLGLRPRPETPDRKRRGPASRSPPPSESDSQPQGYEVSAAALQAAATPALAAPAATGAAAGGPVAARQSVHGAPTAGRAPGLAPALMGVPWRAFVVTPAHAIGLESLAAAAALRQVGFTQAPEQTQAAPEQRQAARPAAPLLQHAPLSCQPHGAPRQQATV